MPIWIQLACQISEKGVTLQLQGQLYVHQHQHLSVHSLLVFRWLNFSDSKPGFLNCYLKVFSWFINVLAFNFETCSGKTYWYKERNIMNIFRLTSFFILCRQETCQVPPKGRLFWEGALHVWYRPEWSCWCILFQIIGSNTCFNSSNFGWVWDRNTGKLTGNYLKLLTRNINCNQWSIEFSPYTWLIGLFFRNCMIKVLGIFGYTTRVLLDACLKM